MIVFPFRGLVKVCPNNSLIRGQTPDRDKIYIPYFFANSILQM